MSRATVAATAAAGVTLAAITCLASVAIGQADTGSLRQQTRTLQSEVSAQRATIGNLETRLSGGNRDVITCGDLQALEQYLDGATFTQMYTGPIEFATSAGQVLTALPLPVHCINQ